MFAGIVMLFDEQCLFLTSMSSS